MNKYMHLTIEELHDKLIKKEVTSAELIKESLELAHQNQKLCNSFVTILDAAKQTEINDNLLSGIPYGIKDNYSTKGILTTGSSNTLKNYVPVFTATAVENLNKVNAIPIGKCALDEFGMGGTGTTAHTGIIKNPWDTTRMCAGSSAGSAASVAAGVYPYALGTDTGDSIRKPAAFCGIVGYKPTYGMISRYGVFPFASSLDTCGVLTRNVKDAAIVVDAMKGIDPKDMTSWDSSNINLLNSIDYNIKNKKLVYIKEICDINNYENPSDELKQHFVNFFKVLEKIKALGITIEEVSVNRKLLAALAEVYMIISCAEATSNMSNLTGIIFGPRGSGKNVNEMMMDHRAKGFSSLIKRRFIIGSYVLQRENQERYFKNAGRVRRLIVDEWKKILSSYDGVILPVSSGPAKKLDTKDNATGMYRTLEEHLQIGNYGGFPSITIPSGFINNLPVAINITGNCYDDGNILNIAASIEKELGYKNQIAKEVTSNE